MTLQRIVVGVDGSPSSDDALQWAAKLASGTDTEIITVHGWSGPEAEGEGDLVVREAAQYLSTHNLTFRSVIEMTDPRELLVQVAEREDADLIVIGSRGKNLVMRFALGSVGEFLAHHSTRPVAIIRPTSTPRA